MKETHWEEGYYEGTQEITCDGCGRKHILVPFHNENEYRDYERIRIALKKEKWKHTTIKGVWSDFCSEACFLKYVKEKT